MACWLQVIILTLNSVSYNSTMDTLTYEVSLVMDNIGLPMASAVRPSHSVFVLCVACVLGYTSMPVTEICKTWIQNAPCLRPGTSAVGSKHALRLFMSCM